MMLTGREESNKRVQDKIDYILKDAPNYLYMYAGEFETRGMSIKTESAYLRIVKYFLEYMRTDFEIDCNDVENLKKIKQMHIYSYLKTKDDIGDSARRVNVYAIKHFFRYLWENEFIETDPAARVRAPKDRSVHQVIALTNEEIATIEKRIKIGWHKPHKGETEMPKRNKYRVMRDLCMFHLAIRTGLRVSEICGLDINDIDFKEGTMTFIEKGGEERIVPIPKSVKEEMEDCQKNRYNFLRSVRTRGKRTRAFFLSDKGSRLTPDQFTVLVKNWSMDIDKNITPHKLRSTFATHFYDATKNIYLTARMLNYKNVNSTMRCLTVEEKQLITGAEIAGNMYNI